jgi:sigma-B regulation protein RsbU (phosphoserine phosphatase)
VIAHVDEAATLVDVEPGPPLGASVGDHRWPLHEVSLPLGAVVAFYTDGLVERRDEPLDDGLERLMAAVVASPPSAVCQTVMSTLVGNRAPDDDVALLAMRRTRPAS